MGYLEWIDDKIADAKAQQEIYLGQGGNGDGLSDVIEALEESRVKYIELSTTTLEHAKNWWVTNGPSVKNITQALFDYANSLK